MDVFDEVTSLVVVLGETQTLERLGVTGDDWGTSPDAGDVKDDALGAPVWGPEVPVAPEAVVALWLWFLQI